MRTPLLLLALAGLALAAPLAAAQQSASLTIYAQTPAEEITAKPVVTTAIAVYTADYTTVTSLSGISVEYTITAAPEWASVVVSPATDVFPLPSGPTPGVTYTVTRQVQVTISTTHDVRERLNGVIELTAITGAAPGGKSSSARATIPIVTGIEETPCPEHEALATEPAEAPASPLVQASASPDDGGEVTVQQAGATPLPTPWLVVAACGLVGAGVGIVLRQRSRQ